MPLIQLSSAQFKLNNKDTDDLSQGSVNKYFSDALARAAVSVTTGTGLGYTSGTGVITYTQGDSDSVPEGSTNLYFTDARVRLNALNLMAAPTADVAMNSKKITGLGTPTGDSDASTKAYVDSIAQGLHWKNSVRVATTANGTLATAYANGQAVDGQTLATNDRILLKNQTTGSQNGIYTVNASGAPTRSSDMNANDEFPGAAVFVRSGSVNADSGWVCTNDAVTVGTTAVTFSQFTGTGQVTAGAGLAKSGNTLSVNVDGSSLEISGDALRVKSNGITSAMIVGNITNAQLANSTISSKALGTNLDSLSSGATSGISMTSYNGSAAVSDISVSLNALSAGVVDVAADSIAIVDANDSNATKKESIADLVSGVAGSGLTAGSGQLSLTANTISGVALGQSLAALTTAATSGITLSSYNGSAAINNLALNLSGLSAGVVNVAGDSIAIIDADDASASKKESIADLVSAMAGSGLTAGSGQLSLTSNAITIAGVSTALGGSITANTIAGQISAGTLTNAQLANSAITIAGASTSLGGAITADAIAGQITSGKITNAQLAGSIVIGKLTAKSTQQGFTGNGSTSEYTLTSYTPSSHHGTVKVYLNGMRLNKVEAQASPANATDYVVSDVGGTQTKVTLGANVPTGDLLYVDHWV